MQLSDSLKGHTLDRIEGHQDVVRLFFSGDVIVDVRLVATSLHAQIARRGPGHRRAVEVVAGVGRGPTSVDD